MRCAFIIDRRVYIGIDLIKIKKNTWNKTKVIYNLIVKCAVGLWFAFSFSHSTFQVVHSKLTLGPIMDLNWLQMNNLKSWKDPDSDFMDLDNNT